MGKLFNHLSYTDRLRIEVALINKMPIKDIAKMLNVHYSTIYREIKRGHFVKKTHKYDYYYYPEKTVRYVDAYSPDLSEEKYRTHLKAKGAPLKIGTDFALANYIEDRILRGGLTPLSVLGEIKRKNLSFDTSICVSTLYSYIYKGVFLTLDMKHLPIKSKKKIRNKVVRAKRPPRGESIENRPDEVRSRTTFGHWEMDCVCGSTKKSLLVLTERLTRKEIILPIARQTADNVVRSINLLERRFGSRFKQIFRTITVDNGTEFSDVVGIESSIYSGQRTKLYYCHPYCSSERGTNERMNREIRRKIPKSTDIGKYSKTYIKDVEKWLNEYPRPVLQYATSEELFAEELKKLK